MNRLLLVIFLIFSPLVSAATFQQIQITNMLYNQDATGSDPGASPDAALVKLFLSGASTACYTTTLAYQGALSVTTGTGQSCTAAVAKITVTPVVSATLGTIYTAPADFVPDSNYAQQLIIQQKVATVVGGVTTYYGPVFDTTNGTVTTPGTAVIVYQTHFAENKQHTKPGPEKA